MSLQAYFGYFFILYGSIIYPVVGYLIEQNLFRTISIGLPCPTTILTFGFFLLCDKKFSLYLLIIPTLWAVIGISTVINLGLYQDSMMIIAAIIADVWLIKRKFQPDMPEKVDQMN
jgi:ATP/ADP translocase